MENVAIIVNSRPGVPERGIFWRRFVKPAAERQSGCRIGVLSAIGRVGALRNQSARDILRPYMGGHPVEWLLFLDDDKVLCAEAVATMMDAARASKADLVYSDYLGICHPGSEHPCGPVWLHRAQAWNPGTLRRGNYIDTTTLVRRSLFEAIGGWDEELERFLDWDLWLRCADAGATGFYVPDVLFHSHYLPGPSITRDVDYDEARKEVCRRHGI